MQDFTIRITSNGTNADDDNDAGKVVVCMSAFCKSSGDAAQQAIEFMGDVEGFAVSVRPNERPAVIRNPRQSVNVTPLQQKMQTA